MPQSRSQSVSHIYYHRELYATSIRAETLELYVFEHGIHTLRGTKSGASKGDPQNIINGVPLAVFHHIPRKKKSGHRNVISIHSFSGVHPPNIQRWSSYLASSIFGQHPHIYNHHSHHHHKQRSVLFMQKHIQSSFTINISLCKFNIIFCHIPYSHLMLQNMGIEVIQKLNKKCSARYII